MLQKIRLIQGAKDHGAKRLENLSTPSNGGFIGFHVGVGIEENEKNDGNMQGAAIGFRDKSICRGAKFSDSSASSSLYACFHAFQQYIPRGKFASFDRQQMELRVFRYLSLNNVR